MGALADHVAAGGTRPTTTSGIQMLLALRRPAPGQTTVQVRLEAAGPNWDGTVWCDEADAVAIVANGLGVLV